MSDRSKLLALAEAVEKLTEKGSFKIETDIAYAFGLPLEGLAAPYTVCLDAAMTLVPKGCWDHMEVYCPDHQTLCWTVHLLPNGNFIASNSHKGTGPSFATALCAAALRAQAEALA